MDAVGRASDAACRQGAQQGPRVCLSAAMHGCVVVPSSHSLRETSSSGADLPLDAETR